MIRLNTKRGKGAKQEPPAKYGTPAKVRRSMVLKRGGWVERERSVDTDSRAMRDMISFWDTYEYRPVIGPMNDATREMAVREYLKARNALGGDFVEVGRHFSVGVNYIATALRSTGGDIMRGDEVRYDIVMELYMHAPAVQSSDGRRLLTKGAVMDTRNGTYTNVYVGPIREMDMNHEKGTGRIQAGHDGDIFDVTFSLSPAQHDEYDKDIMKRWVDEGRTDR